MTKSLEPEVTERTLQWLRAEFKGKAMFDTGEIPVGEGKWRADIVGYDKVLGTKREMIAVECKGKYQISKGVGQALSYSYAGIPSMISGYCMDESELRFIGELPLYCLNVKETSVKLVSKPNNASAGAILDDLISEQQKITVGTYKTLELLELCKNLTELKGYDVSEVEPEDILRHLINEAKDNNKHNYIKPRELLTQ